MRRNWPTRMGSCLSFIIGMALCAFSELAAQPRAVDWDSILKTAQMYFSSPSPENASKLLSALPESEVAIKYRYDQRFSRMTGYLYGHLYDLEKPMQTDKTAIAVAFRLFNVSDGGFSEELDNQLGDLSDTNPQLFLAVLRCNMEHLDVICCGKSIDQFYMEGKKKEHDEYLMKRITVIRSVGDDRLSPLIEKCVDRINSCLCEKQGAPSIVQLSTGHQGPQDPSKLKLEKFNARYLAKSRESPEGRLSAYDEFLSIDRSQLNSRSLELYDDVSAIFKAPLDDSAWVRYITDFPREFSEFSALFCGSVEYSPELARHGSTFLMLLEDFVRTNPHKGIPLILNLANFNLANFNSPIGDCGGFDELQNLLERLFCEEDDLTIEELQKLSKAGQHNVVRFICTVADIKGFTSCIIKKLKEKNRTDVQDMFEQEISRRRK